MKRWIYILPVAAFAAIAFFLFRSLLLPDPAILPSALLNRPAPRLTLPALDAQTEGFGPAQLASGHVTVVNVFGSWCIECHVEAPVMMRLAQQKGFELYGLVQRDTPEKARAFLDESGNPFSRIGIDRDDRASIEWGVYGAPETFVVDGKGIVRFKLIGALTDQAVTKQLLPAIEEAKQAS